MRFSRLISGLLVVLLVAVSPGFGLGRALFRTPLTEQELSSMWGADPDCMVSVDESENCDSKKADEDGGVPCSGCKAGQDMNLCYCCQGSS